MSRTTSTPSALPEPIKLVIKSCKRDLRGIEAQIERIILTYGEEPTDPQVAKHLDGLCDKWTALRFAISNARAAGRGQLPLEA